MNILENKTSGSVESLDTSKLGASVESLVKFMQWLDEKGYIEDPNKEPRWATDPYYWWWINEYLGGDK